MHIVVLGYLQYVYAMWKWHLQQQFPSMIEVYISLCVLRYQVLIAMLIVSIVIGPLSQDLFDLAVNKKNCHCRNNFYNVP